MNPMYIGLALSGLFGGSFLANEWTHGGMSEAMGMGHHHALDAEGIHCVSHADEKGAQHMEHMHGDQQMPHDGCPGGAGMHGSMGRMMEGSA